MNNKSKIIIYQLFPRLFTNTQPNPVFNGTIAQNGAGKMNQIDTRVLNSLRDMGVTHVWYTGIVQHASKTDYSAYGIHKSNPHVVKGNAGSPYAITDYYDVDPDIAVDVNQRMKEFEQLVQRTHACGLKVVLDFVPNHVARQYRSLAKPKGVEDLGQTDDKGMFFSPNNNFYYITGKSFSPSVDMGEGDDKYVEYPAKATGNDCFHECPGVNDWFETVKLNYGLDPWNGSKHFSPIPSTWTKMCNILLFWAAKGVDAFRCDMVHMVPVEFWHWAIAKVKEQYPDVVFIAELYDVGIYHSYIHYGGFDYLYDKVNLYDKLCAIVKNEESAASLTQCWQTVEGMQAHMLNFLENHDELRLASPQQFGDAELAFPAVIVSATMSTSPFMLYQGQELGEDGKGAIGYSGDDGRTSIFDYTTMPLVEKWYSHGKCSIHKINNKARRIRAFYTKVLKMCATEQAISQGAFFDLMYVNYQNLNPQKQYVYLRHFDHETLLIGVNFHADDAELEIDIPAHAFQCLGIQSGVCFMKELLSGKQKTAEFSPTAKFQMRLPAHGGVVWKIVH